MGILPVDFVKPLLHIVERFSIGDVIHNNDTVSSTIVAAGDGAETFLTGSVPLINVSVMKANDKNEYPTIWSLMVFPSNSTVRIFYAIIKQIICVENYSRNQHQ